MPENEPKCCWSCKWYKLKPEGFWLLLCTHPDCYPGTWVFDCCSKYERSEYPMPLLWREGDA